MVGDDSESMQPEDCRNQRSFPARRSTAPKFPLIDGCLLVTKQEISKLEASLMVNIREISKLEVSPTAYH